MEASTPVPGRQVFAPSCMDIIEGLIKVTIDKTIQRLARKF
jgi:hypothetical protein